MNMVQRKLISIYCCARAYMMISWYWGLVRVCVLPDSNCRYLLQLCFKSDWPVKRWSVRVWRSKEMTGRAFVSTSTVLPSVSTHFITITLLITSWWIAFILIVRCCDLDDSMNVDASSWADSVDVVRNRVPLEILLSIWWIVSRGTLL